MNINKEHILNLIKNLEFEEAISHRVHSRVFEVLGYLSIVDREALTDEARGSLESIEELNKKLLEEIHLIIDYYTAKKAICHLVHCPTFCRISDSSFRFSLFRWVAGTHVAKQCVFLIIKENIN